MANAVVATGPGTSALAASSTIAAEVLDAAAGAAAVLGDRDAEQAEAGQAREHRLPGFRLTLLDIPDRRRRAGAGSPVADQLPRRKLFVGDGADAAT